MNKLSLGKKDHTIAMNKIVYFNYSKYIWDLYMRRNVYKILNRTFFLHIYVVPDLITNK